jgi:hypothetical protein
MESEFYFYTELRDKDLRIKQPTRTSEVEISQSARAPERTSLIAGEGRA